MPYRSDTRALPIKLLCGLWRRLQCQRRSSALLAADHNDSCSKGRPRFLAQVLRRSHNRPRQRRKASEMSGEDDQSRPLSPESQGLPSKKPKGPEDDDTKSPPQASPSPGAGEGTQDAPMPSPGAGEGTQDEPMPSPEPGEGAEDEPVASDSRATGARPRTTTPKSRSRSRTKDRSKSPLQKVSALFKKSPKPKLPDEGGTPKDVQEATAQWVRSKSMSPPPAPTEAKAAKRPSKKEKKKQELQGPALPGFYLRIPDPTPLLVVERLPQDILDKEGIPKKAPLASSESMSTASSGSTRRSAKPSTSSGGAVRPPPPSATPRPSDWAGPEIDEEEEATEKRQLRPRRKEEPKK